MTAAAPATSTQLPRPGDMIAGKYVLDRLLGQGGMGAVFAARHVKLSKAVAIKIMLADASNPEAAQRFVNEGRAAANINDDHVVKVDDVDEESGYAYMVLELLDGEDLSQVLARHPEKRLDPRTAVHYALQAVRGVSQAHAIGIVHRDLKPSNLFLARRKDGSVIVKVLDFGISKAAGTLGASPNALTSTKAMLGSPLYMSPEQLRSSKSVDHRADIWAMGVILYELLTGNLPFGGDNLGELFAAILENDPVPPRQYVPSLHPRIDEIVVRCLQRRPENRFQTIAELSQALAPFAGAEPPAPGPSYSGFQTAPHVHAMTPPGMSTGPRPMMATNPQRIVGTVPLGAVTPQPPGNQTNSSWQSTGMNAPEIPKSRTLLILVAVGGVLALLLGGVALYFIVAKPKVPIANTDPSASVSVAVGAPPPSGTPPAAVSTAPPPEPPPPATAEPSADPPKPTTQAHPSHKPPPPPPPPPPTTKPPVPAPPPAPKPTTNTSGGLQNAR